MDTAPITRGPKYCYSSPHTIKPLPESDERRIRDDALVLHTSPNLQQQINDIPTTIPNIKCLVIQSAGCYDDSLQLNLDVAMPKLEKLKLIDVAFDKVVLNKELTPLIEDLFMQNVPDDCDITVQLPELKSFSMYYYGPPDDETWFHEMLEYAKKLKAFDSYKLRIGHEPHFASNDLKSIRLHRAECMESISIYAPNLEELNLQACYGLMGTLTILDTHPNFTRPSGQSSRFLVNTRMHASLNQFLERSRIIPE